MPYLMLIAAYLIGSVPFGYILTRLTGKTDIREHGSGNIGATNVLRVLGWRAALPVFVLDLLKGMAAVLLAKAVSDLPAFYLAAGLLAMIGHSFPIFLRFKGGKAAATGIGVLLVVSGWAILIIAAVALLVIALTRYVSLGSLLGALATPVYFYLFNFDLNHILFGLALALLVIARHHANIVRLLKGTEPKLGEKK